MQDRDRFALAARFGIPVEDGREWIDDLLAAEEADLIELAKYLDVTIPGQSGDFTVDPSAADIDAYAELVSAETALRDVIRIAVPKWQADFDAEALGKLEAKRAEEDTRRDGVAVSQDLLEYTEIYQLQEIINRYWDPDVKAILADKKRTDVYLGIIFDVRNSIGHSRPVFASERLLLAGAAGQIRNQLASYRAKADGPQRYYPSIDSARDSAGREGRKDAKLYKVSADALPGLPRLDVGDTIVFELEATDPRGRDLIWKGYSIVGSTTPSLIAHNMGFEPFVEATGERVRVTWVVGDGDVGEYRQIVFTLQNSGRYHRESSWDDGVMFFYHVNPPPDA
ncbi:hypothetical protein A5676_18320 [Mycobacterium malmoense]|nr:hypothetical protein A5676_18320 [Mycobacterium malmoense]